MNTTEEEKNRPWNWFDGNLQHLLHSQELKPNDLYFPEIFPQYIILLRFLGAIYKSKKGQKPILSSLPWNSPISKMREIKLLYSQTLRKKKDFYDLSYDFSSYFANLFHGHFARGKH